MKAMIKTVAAVATLVLATPAFAGGVTVAEKGESKLKLSGKAFINFTNSTTENKTTGVKTASSTGFAVDRFYLQAVYHINDVWYGRITTDVNNEQGNTTPGLKRNMNVFLKYAFIEGNFSDAAQLRLGLSHTPWIDYEQGLWKHRYVAKVASDHWKYDDSADYGVGLKGKLADGMFKYWVTATNGGGYGKPNKTDGIDLNSRVTVSPIKGLDISAQYRTGYRGAKTFGTNPARQSLSQAMISYGDHNWRAGINYMKNTNDLNTLDNETYALWGWGKFNDDFGAFGRYDREKNKLTAASNVDTQYVLGLEYFAAKGMSFSAAYTLQDNQQNNTKVKTAGLYSQFKF